MRKLTFLLTLCLTSTLLTGCGTTDSTDPAIERSAKMLVSATATQPAKAATTTRSGTSVPEKPKLDDKWLAPMEEGENFFSPPHDDSATEASSTAESKPEKRPDIRLLGIAKIDGIETPSQAIVRFQGQMLYRRVGEKLDDILVVDIGPRSITLQSDRKRWTIELNQQASEKPDNQYASSLFPTSRRGGNWNEPRSSVSKRPGSSGYSRSSGPGRPFTTNDPAAGRVVSPTAPGRQPDIAKSALAPTPLEPIEAELKPIELPEPPEHEDLPPLPEIPQEDTPEPPAFPVQA